jgi:phage terminase small subunit
MTIRSKQRRFAEEYALDHNGAAAAVRAGYAPISAKVTAARLLTKANVRAVVTAHEVRAAERLEVTREQVLAELQEAVRLARLKQDPVSMVAAWREVAKMCGFYAPIRQQIEGYADTQSAAPLAQLRGLTNAELATWAGHDKAASIAA